LCPGFYWAGKLMSNSKFLSFKSRSGNSGKKEIDFLTEDVIPNLRNFIDEALRDNKALDILANEKLPR
jgi:hypothetical protein